MAYATVDDIQERTTHIISEEEASVCEALLEDAAVLIDAYNSKAAKDAKRVVSCRMVLRTVGDNSEIGIPMGATQGSMSALGYSQSWTLGSGAVGELYLSKQEKKLLGIGDHIGSHSPVEDICRTPEVWS